MPGQYIKATSASFQTIIYQSTFLCYGPDTEMILKQSATRKRTAKDLLQVITYTVFQNTVQPFKTDFGHFKSTSY
jgi:hypothetical protein